MINDVPQYDAAIDLAALLHKLGLKHAKELEDYVTFNYDYVHDMGHCPCCEYDYSDSFDDDDEKTSKE